MKTINRRDFLKFTGVMTSALAFSHLLPKIKTITDVPRPNIIIILFDAMSARNLSLHGYHRETSPNLERFAARSLVYHSHYAGGNFTIPGTATLLTGTYPWTHRAINYSGQVNHENVRNNIFHALGDDYLRIAYGQNTWANFILTQFVDDIDILLPPDSFSEAGHLPSHYFPNDPNVATRAFDDFLFELDSNPASILLGAFQRSLYYRSKTMADEIGYPQGISHMASYPISFRLDTLFDGVESLILNLMKPSFLYLHLYPPHAPYRPTDSFFGKFVDGWSPVNKPLHRLGAGLSNQGVKKARRGYDEYVASTDWEFGQLLDTLEKNKVFEDSYVIVTSDHGEMFERGENGHGNNLLYDPVVRIPLMISTPGQSARKDIYSNTHAVDVLPTLLQIAGKPLPIWGDGRSLPGLGGQEDQNRSIYMLEAKSNPAHRKLQRATIAIQKDNYKLIYYTGYESEDSFELYDLNADVEELDNLYPDQPAVAKGLRDELLDSLSDANKPYSK